MGQTLTSSRTPPPLLPSPTVSRGGVAADISFCTSSSTRGWWLLRFLYKPYVRLLVVTLWLLLDPYILLPTYVELYTATSTWTSPSGYSVDFMKDDTGGVPTWNGDPASFEAFATACKWYTLSLKEGERRLAESRVWQRLQGAAKSVVRHLDPSEYDAGQTPGGCEILATSTSTCSRQLFEA